MLRVVVESAKGIPKKKLGHPDPIAAVVFKGEKKKTKAIDSELNPVWNEVLEFDLKGSPLDASSFLDVIVKDYETIGKDKFIGSAKISLLDLARGHTKSLPAKNLSLEHRHSTDRHNQDLHLALEKVRSELQQRKEQLNEKEGERLRAEEDMEKTIRELRTSLL